MKKRLALVLLVLVLCAGVAAADALVKGGVDLLGELQVDTLSGDTELGFSVAAEYLYPIFKFFEVGAGVEYQIFRVVEGASSGFSFVPVYGVIRTPIDIAFFAPYATGRIGYAYPFFEGGTPSGVVDRGGLHWAVGGGILIKRLFLVEAVYCYYNSARDVDLFGTIYSMDITHKKLSIYAGLNFSFGARS